MIFFIASKIDLAGMNIAKSLLGLIDFEEMDKKFCGNPVYSAFTQRSEEVRLIFVDDEPINTQNLPYPGELRMVIFISRHSSRSGTPTLSVHTPGNIGRADLGGLPRKVSISPASAMKAALIEMRKTREEMNLPYEVSYECTHHGPSLDIPAMFVELGSSPEQWRDVKAAEAVARGALAAAVNWEVYPTVLGIGGQHYNRKFTQIALTSRMAFGHMIPKHSISDFDEYMLRQCINKTVEPVKKILLDWKGIKGVDKEPLIKLIKTADLEMEKV